MFDPHLVATFLAIVEEGNFTAAARRLGVGPSTISQHVRRLEQETGRRLFSRDTHRVAPTVDGEAFVDLARRIVEAQERARAYFAASELRGRIRFGVSEDFALSPLLPHVLRRFSARYPSIDLELRVGLSTELHALLDDAAIDLLFAKRRPQDERGVTVWHDRLVWLAAPDWAATAGAALPLVLYPPPSITRALVLEALDRAGIPWRVACTCGSLGGLRAAIAAGLGISAQSSRLVPDGLATPEEAAGLPPLPHVDFILLSATRRPPPAVRAIMTFIQEIM